MATNPQRQAKVRTAANALTVAVATLGVIAGLNVIVTRVSTLRWDMTQDKVYRLSDASRDLVKGLPDRMTAKAFISSGLQPPLNAYGQYIRDLLEEYAAASGGKLQWEAIDPTAPGKDAEETRSRRDEFKNKYKLRPITLEIMKENKLEIGSDNYLGVSIVYGEQIESIPQIASTEGLEYQITNLIRKVTRAKQKKIGFVGGEGTATPERGLQMVSRITQDYESTTVTLDKPIPDDVDLVLSIGARTPFSDKAKYFLDQYLMKGKPLGLFLDGMVIEAPQGMQMPGQDMPRIGRGNDVNVEDWIGKYGLKIREDLILDEQNVPGPVPVEGQLFLANYPTFVGVDRKGLAKGHAMTDHIDVLILPFTSSIELLGDLKDGKASAKATAIATSSAKSWRQSGFFVFNPTIKLEKSAEGGPFTLGYALEGKLKSAFPNGPGDVGGTSTPEAATTIKESPDGTRLIVMSSSGLFTDQNLPLQQVPLYRSNLLFFLNTVDWLAHDESLISLRSKGAGARPLTIPPDSKASFWRYACELGIPALVVLLGIALWYVRNSRRKILSI